MANSFDLIVIGGGINGCGIARDASGRGARVYLCEMNDLASGTSSWSTKLIHGGLRYLEYYEFRLVREALIEREILWKAAPHIIAPLRLILPHHKGLRPAWLLRLGLFLYDHLGGRKLLPPTKVLDLTRDEGGKPLKKGLYTKGFEYSDARVDDARLVVLNARDAADHGAVIETQTIAVSAERSMEGWALTVEDRQSGARKVIHGKVLVNAAGPWVADVLSAKLRSNAKAKVRLVQGSHIVVRKAFDHDRAYIFQNADGRIIFAIPYQDDFTLIGTTDRDYQGDPAKVYATEEEISYLVEAASAYFEKPILREDVVWTFSGVRPLYDDGASEAKAATRDYVFDVDEKTGLAPLLSIFGGKITTYRRLAQAALAKLTPWLGMLNARKSWTARVPLPGGNFPVNGKADLAVKLSQNYPFLEPSLAARLIRSYGTRAWMLLGEAKSVEDLGQHFGHGLYAAEVRYLHEDEWARTAEDVLWRRSKLGLYLNAESAAALEHFMRTLL